MNKFKSLELAPEVEQDLAEFYAENLAFYDKSHTVPIALISHSRATVVEQSCTVARLNASGRATVP